MPTPTLQEATDRRKTTRKAKDREEDAKSVWSSN